MKRFLVYLCLALSLFFLLLNFNILVFADELDNEIISEITKIDLTDLESIFNDNSDINFSNLLNDIISSEYNSFNDYFNNIFNIFLGYIQDEIPTFITILVIILLFTILSEFVSNKNSKDITHFVVSIILYICFSYKIFNLLKNSFETISFFDRINQVLTPILLTLLLSCGGTNSASVMSPISVLYSQFTSIIVKKILFPICIVSFIFSIISSFSKKFNLKEYEELLYSLNKWILGILSIFFTSIISIQGLMAGSTDSIKLKAGKYAIGSSISIISSIVSNGIDLLSASSIIIKNSIGYISIFLLSIVIIKNIIPLIFYNLLFKLLAISTKKIDNNEISNFCTSISKLLINIIAIIVISFLMFFIIILIGILCTNAFI